MNTHETARPQHGLGLWWFLLIASTVVSITLNLWHALSIKPDAQLVRDACAVSTTLCERASHVAAQVVGIHPVLGIIFAIVPPLFAALLSHGLVNPLVGAWIKRAILGLFGISMATSIVSQAAVMRPYGGGYWAEWAIPLVLDASALISLHAITTAATAAQTAARTEELREELEPALRTELERKFRAELAAREEELRAELERNKTEELAAREEELRAELEGNFGTELAEREQEIRQELVARIQAAEEEIRARAESEMQERIRDAVIAAEARVRLELTKTGTGGKRPQKEISAAGKTGGDQQPNKRDRAASILRAQPDIAPKDLAVMLDCTPKYARNLINELAPEPGNGPDETPGEEVRLRAVP